MSETAFTHHGFNMADIRHKVPSQRRAVAVGEFLPGANAYRRIVSRTLPKGDAIVLAEVAGLQAAKNASSLLPLCHPLPLELVNVYSVPVEERHAIRVYCEVATTCKTGVEMEALAGVSAALLTLYDLTKPIEPALEMGAIHLLFKEGGKSGLYVCPQGLTAAERDQFKPQQGADANGLDAQVLTLSDRASSGEYNDRTGPAVADLLATYGFAVGDAIVLPDDAAGLDLALRSAIDGKVPLVVCNGGTGVSLRDITPDVVRGLGGRELPGFGERMRSEGLHETAMSPVSRSVAVQVQHTLVVAVPGSSKGAVASIRAVRDALIHAVKVIARDA